MDTHRLYIDSRCRICAVNVNDDKRKCEVLSFIDECKALWSVDIEEDHAEIHPTSICHKCKKTLLRFRSSQQSGKKYETNKQTHQWMPHAPLNCICVSGEGESSSLESKLKRPSCSGPGPGRPSLQAVKTVKPSAESDTDTSTDTASESEETSGDYVAHVADKIRRYYPALPAETALQLATELGERYGFVTINLANVRGSLAALESSVLSEIVEEAVSLNRETVKREAFTLGDDTRKIDKLVNLDPAEWLQGKAPLIRGIVTGLSDSKTPTIAKVIAAEHLYGLVNRNFMAPFSFAKNVVSYSLTRSKILLDLNGKMHPGGRYSNMKVWLDNMALDLLPFPKGDVLVAFDNDQIVQKRWTVRVDNKAKVSILTSVCHAEVDQNGSLQRRADLSPR